jgi:hypothetical protein
MSTLPRGAFVPSGKPTSGRLTECIAVRRPETCLGACAIEGEGGYPVTAAATAALAHALIATGSCFDPQELFTLEDPEQMARDLSDDARRRGL